jgi:hypothetical protein
MRQLGVGVGAGAGVGGGVGAGVGAGVGGGVEVGRVVCAAVRRAVGAGVAPSVGPGVRWVSTVGAAPPGVTGVVVTTCGDGDALLVGDGLEPGSVDGRTPLAETAPLAGTSWGGPIPDVDGLGMPCSSAAASAIVTTSTRPRPTAVWRYNGSMPRSLSIGRLHARACADTIGARDRRGA